VTGAGGRLAFVLVAVAACSAWVMAVHVAHVTPVFVPDPADVIGEIWRNPQLYARHTAITFATAVGGLVVGTGTALALAIASWWTPAVGGVATSFALLMRAVPIVAIIPVLATIGGYGIRTVAAITVLVAYFPAYIVLVTALRRPRSTAGRDLLRVLGARRSTMLWRVELPSAVPQFASALRISSVACVTGTIIGEFLIGDRGLGVVFITARLHYEIPRSWAAALIAAAVSFALFALASELESRCHARWR
jgi:putative hydroxymethylpyrimidine transport system permease protein